MQNHMDRSGSNSYSAMLSSSQDPCFAPEHDFNHLNNGSSADFTQLLSHSQQQQHLHHLHHNSHGLLSNNETNNNLTSVANHNHSNNQSNQNNHSSSGSNNNNNKPKKIPPPNGKKTKGRVKIKMEFIDNKLRRYTTFSKRKTGIMKKAYELSTLTGTQVMLLVASETGHVYTFATRKLQPMITSEAGKALIQTCLNSPDPPTPGDSQRMSATGYEETELTYGGEGTPDSEPKDDESESGSCSEDEAQKDVPTLNSILPSNFAALFASASAAGFSGLKNNGLSIGLVPTTSSTSSNISSISNNTSASNISTSGENNSTTGNRILNNGNSLLLLPSSNLLVQSTPQNPPTKSPNTNKLIKIKREQQSNNN